jgi:flagellar biosynthesis chaperone FliJ
VTDPAARTERLVATRRQAAADKQAHALATVDRLLARGEQVSFVDVHRAAGVSTWFVYNNPTVRDAIEQAIRHQRERHAANPAKPADDRTLPGLRTELAHARAEIRDLRDERDRLRSRLHRDLGEQVDAIGKRELQQQARTLELETEQLQSTLRDVTDELVTKTRDLDQALADLDGTRLAIRHMMRERASAIE